MEKIIAQYLKIFKENTVDCITEDEIAARLKESIHKKKPLIAKIGFDPTAADIHLGHTVLLRKLRKLQDLGQVKVCLIIGDFTARIGDPSGQAALRPVLSDSQIKKNAATYTQQVFTILDKKKTIVRYNSQWFKGMGLADFLSLLSCYTLARILERDDFSQRFKENRPLTMLELAYPLIQGYDSVKVRADIEFGGTDQKFNLLVGRYLQQVYHQKPQAIVTMPILVGLDGVQKMSKSLGNYIGVREDPKSMFGKIMSISDEVMWEYFRLLTDENVETMKKHHPKEAKLMLASQMVAEYHSLSEAQKQRREFERVFSLRKLPENMPVFHIGSSTCNIIESLHKFGFVASKNEARRLYQQGAIYEVKPKDFSQLPLKQEVISISPQGLIVKIGKKKFVKFMP